MLDKIFDAIAGRISNTFDLFFIPYAISFLLIVLFFWLVSIIVN